MGWIQGPLLKMKPYFSGDENERDEWYAVVKVGPDDASIVGYSVTNPLDVVKELEARLNPDRGQA